MPPIIIIAAVPKELSILVSSLHAEKISDRALTDLYAADLGKHRILIAASGIGKVNAASAASSLVYQWEPSLLINVGCAGAYPPSGLRIGDIAVASSDIYSDEGLLTPDGWCSMESIGIPVIDKKGNLYFNEIPLSFSPAEKAVRLASALDVPLRRGRFATVSTCTGTTERAVELFKRFGAICESMEGAAIAQVALQYGIDSLEIRGISNMVEDRDLGGWDISKAVEQSQRFLLRYLEQCIDDV